MADVTRHRGGGVTRSGERWRARLWTSGTAVSLGYYATREEAQAAIDAQRYAHLAPEGLRGVAAEMAGAFAGAVRKDGER